MGTGRSRPARGVLPSVWTVTNASTPANSHLEFLASKNAAPSPSQPRPCGARRYPGQPKPTGPHRLLAVRSRDLPHALGPGHVHGAVDGPPLRPPIVLAVFHRQRGVAEDDHARLQRTRNTSSPLGTA